MNIKSGEIMYCIKSYIILKPEGIDTLKEKRSIVKTLINALRKNFQLSVMEYGELDSKKFIGILYAQVSDSKDYLLKSSENIEIFIEEKYGLEIYSNDYDIF
ncbi:MAG TPA: DUF503 family protein [Tepiditoga sp.]|nr:DUF503 family protein [Tepiditoga sp.]